MIPIIFYQGTHGNYVEFVLNKVIHGSKIHAVNPLTHFGTSHSGEHNNNDNYWRYRTFKCNHLHNININIIKHRPFIKIEFGSSDDLFVTQLSLKRSSDHNIDSDTLEFQTYHQLFAKYGSGGNTVQGPHNIITDINKFTDLAPYYNIKDTSWPEINSVDDFYNLPQHILDECIQVFGYRPVQVTADRPDAPRWVLRSIFKSWFYNQSISPSNIISPLDDCANVYKLPLRNLYDTVAFRQEIINIGKFLNIEMNLDNFSSQVHQQFIDMVPYKESRLKCERIINSIGIGDHFQISLNVVEEGYVNYCLEQKFNITMPEETEQYFKDTSELSTYIKNELRNR